MTSPVPPSNNRIPMFPRSQPGVYPIPTKPVVTPPGTNLLGGNPPRSDFGNEAHTNSSVIGDQNPQQATTYGTSAAFNPLDPRYQPGGLVAIQFTLHRWYYNETSYMLPYRDPIDDNEMYYDLVTPQPQFVGPYTDRSSSYPQAALCIGLTRLADTIALGGAYSNYTDGLGSFYGGNYSAANIGAVGINSTGLETVQVADFTQNPANHHAGNAEGDLYDFINEPSNNELTQFRDNMNQFQEAFLAYYVTGTGFQNLMQSRLTMMNDRTRHAQILMQAWVNYMVSLGVANVDAQANPIHNILANTFNGAVISIATVYDAQATALNANPVVRDPVNGSAAAAMAAVATVTGIANGLVATVTGILNGGMAAINALKTGTVDPTVKQVETTLGQQGTFILGQVTAALATADAAVKSAVATINNQVTLLGAEVDRQAAAANKTVSDLQVSLMAEIARQIQNMLVIAGQLTTLAGQVSQTVLDLVLGTVASTQAQLADRPLFWGALTQPITVTSPTDVIVIPAGGLIITAD